MFQTWLGENAPLWKSPNVSKHCLRDIVLRQLLVIMGRSMEWSGLSAGRGRALNLTPGNQLLIWGMHPLYWMSTSGCMACEWINQNTRHWSSLLVLSLDVEMTWICLILFNRLIVSFCTCDSFFVLCSLFFLLSFFFSLFLSLLLGFSLFLSTVSLTIISTLNHARVRTSCSLLFQGAWKLSTDFHHQLQTMDVLSIDHLGGVPSIEFWTVRNDSWWLQLMALGGRQCGQHRPQDNSSGSTSQTCSTSQMSSSSQSRNHQLHPDLSLTNNSAQLPYQQCWLTIKTQ